MRGKSMVKEDLGSVFRRKDGKYFVYVPQRVAEDSAFPFDVQTSTKVLVKITDDGKISIEPVGNYVNRPWGLKTPRRTSYSGKNNWDVKEE
jgi:hypothetical protein